VSCPHCGRDARFVEYRKTAVTCLLGNVVYQRAYYHCRHCSSGWFPTDEEFGIAQKQSPAARQVIALAGTLEPFAHGGGRVLPRMTGLNLSASTVRRTTETVGEDVARRRAAGQTFGPARPWNWHADAQGQRVACVSLDATAVLQQGPQAEKAEARMPWVAAVLNPPPAPERGRAVRERRYVAGLMALPEIGAQLRRECQAVGVAQADVVVALTDGGAGLEECLQDALSGLGQEVVFVLDFYHAAEHLREFAKVLFPQPESRQSPLDAWCHTLKHQGGAALLAELEGLDLAQAPPAAIEAHRLLTGYLRSNQHRTDYPTYLARGWQIGSGLIEAACKTVIGQRLKESGMRWRPRGTTALSQLRALYKSQPELWDYYWSHIAM
jgi:hypothetical protein